MPAAAAWRDASALSHFVAEGGLTQKEDENDGCPSRNNVGVPR
jgi:hypothetical protein